METFWNSSNLLKILIKWKWHIVSITFVGMLVIGAATYLIKPKYSSTAIVYPVNLGGFSEESFSEQMIQILKSREITDKIIEKYDLSKHYEIDKSYKHYQSTMYYLYNENVSINKTEYESIEISVLDIDADYARNIVNSILAFYNEKVRTMHRIKLKERIVVSENQVKYLNNQKDSLQKVINSFGKEFNYADDYYVKNSTGEKFSSKSKQINRLNKQGADYFFLTNMFGEVSQLLLNYKLGVQQDLVEYQKKITYFSLVSEPYASDKKASPNRITYTLLGGMSVFALIILVIGFVENKNHNI